MRTSLTLAATAAFASSALAADATAWRSQSIYQIMTDRFARTDADISAPCDVSNNDYCGGTWYGISQQLDYIQGMGFTAVWISPITSQLTEKTQEGAGYHGYWPQNLYTTNSHFGTDDDLKALIKAVHDRGMYFMIDIIPNHLAWPGDHSTIDYSKFVPFNDKAYFHDFCDLASQIQGSPSNATDILEKCWLGDNIVALADLKTEDPKVAGILNDWVRDTVNKYNIDGLRIDAAKHIAPEFFPPFLQAAGGIFGMGEVLDGDAPGACKWQKDSIGSVLNYPIYFPIRRVFGSTNWTMSEITSELAKVNAACSDPTLLGAFSESHDLDRFPTLSQDMAQAANLLTYSFLTDGIPIIYQGQEQHVSGYSGDNTNRQALWTVGYKTTAPLYKHTALLNAVRSAAIKLNPDWTTSAASVVQEDEHTLAMAKGPADARTLIVVNNNGAKSPTTTLTVRPAAQQGALFAAGSNVTDVVSCAPVLVQKDGSVNVQIVKGQPVILVAPQVVKAAGLCGQNATAGGAQASEKKGAAARMGVGRTGLLLVGVALGFVVML